MKSDIPPQPVPRRLVGENAPSVRPGDDPALYGSAQLTPTHPVETRTYQTFTLTYTVGRLGIDDTGAIRVSFRVVTDAGFPQCTDPTAANYVSATTTGSGEIRLRCSPEGPRPWYLTVTAELRGGYLKEGDRIVLVFGDTRHGSPGMLMQTFVEQGYEFRVSTDVQATGNFLPLDTQFAVPVVAGPAARWRAVLPTLRRPGETFTLGLKAEDAYGNPTANAEGRIRLQPSVSVAGLPSAFEYDASARAMCFEGLRVDSPGTLWVEVFVDDEAVCEAGPLIVADGHVAQYWGDLHGQTGETVGVTSIESYFHFARNLSFLDVSSHQANDFQINRAFWAHLNTLTADWNEPGRFTVLPGYEWSGNTAVGGDHNVYFAEEGRQIVRCSHALLEDRSDIDTDAHTLTDLFAAMRGTNTVIYAHVGGRYCNLDYDHDPVLETAVEMHSAWGTFEWVLTDALALGRRVGVVCNSDGHKGRPGASYPGASVFGAMGGLTCFLTPENTRAAIMEAQRRRHHYGTTGSRLFLDVRADLPAGSRVYERDPAALPEAPHTETGCAIMGDVVAVAGGAVNLSLQVEAGSGIERVEIRRGAEILQTLRPYSSDSLGARVRVLCSGAEYRGRGRDTRWRGRATFQHAEIARIEAINNWNPERVIEQRGSDMVVFDVITTGNFAGFDAWLDRVDDARLELATNHGTVLVDLATLDVDPVTREAGGLARRLSVQRLPETPLPRSFSATSEIPIAAAGDTPIWVAVTTEDGHQAWSSPIYAFRS